MVTEHVSMTTQWDPSLTVQDCFKTFSQKYVVIVMITMVTYCPVESSWPVTTHGIVPVARPTSQLLGYYQFRNFPIH